MTRTPARLAVTARPFVKWAGGKTQLLERFEGLYPDLPQACAYHEPFAGSAAVFFHLASIGRLPRRTVLSDLNAHLVTAFCVVRDEPSALARRLEALRHRHSPDEYYRQRERFNSARLGPRERAALLVYLNKAGFNGLYRVNAKGELNVPCGRQSGGLGVPGEDLLRACSDALRRAMVLHAPFASVLERARSGDFVYFDPPYVPVSKTAFFTDYSKEGFGPADQVRLRDVFVELDRRGCKVMLSNSGTRRVRDLYGGFHFTALRARRSINSKTTARGPVPELVVRNYD